jgi:hypothetical protein
MTSLSLGSVELHSEAEKLVDWLEGASSSMSTVDWLLAVAALAILFWLRATSRSKTRVGPVEVNSLECDSSRAKIHAVTASLREQLASSGFLPAPAVPAGTPQTNLVDAVAASPIPQGAFIAKLIELVPFPQPVQYTLSGTLLGEAGKQDCGISFWLRPSGGGLPLMRTLEKQHTHYKAVEQAAFEIYAHISNEAVDAFPTWTRWRSVPALKAYKDGCQLACEGAMARAIFELLVASKCEPGNALVRLQLANLYEQQAEANAGLQANALRRYLDIACEWPWLVQARYRASILAGVLASSCKVDTSLETSAVVRSQLNPADVSPQQLADWLQQLAKAESAAVLQMLKWWYVPLRYMRTRHQFEPSAKERRELKRALDISRQCLRVRLVSANEEGLLVWLKLRWSEWVVHGWHLVFGGTVDWQTRYLAACFDALLLERARRLNEPPSRQRALRERALAQMTKAIAEAGDQLSRTWVEKGDPDLQSLREPLQEDWEISLRQLPEAKRRTEAQVSRSNARQQQLGYPARPWPKPTTRKWCWLGFALVSLVGAVVLIASWGVGTALWQGVPVALAGVGLWRWQAVRREAGFPD